MDALWSGFWLIELYGSVFRAFGCLFAGTNFIGELDYRSSQLPLLHGMLMKKNDNSSLQQCHLIRI